MPSSEHLRGLFGGGGGGGEGGGGGMSSPSKGGNGTRKPTTKTRTRRRKRKRKGAGRRVDCMVEVCLSHVSARIDTYLPPTPPSLPPSSSSSSYRSSTSLINVLDFYVLDRIFSVQPRRILGYWRSDSEHPRDGSECMVEVQMAAVCPMYDATVGMGGGAGVVNLSSSAPPVVMTTTMAGAKVLEEEEGEVDMQKEEEETEVQKEVVGAIDESAAAAAAPVAPLPPPASAAAATVPAAAAAPEAPIEELILRVRLLPLRVHVDQHTLDFLSAFFTLAETSSSSSSTSSSTSSSHPEQTDAQAQAQATLSLLPSLAFFQSILIRPVKIKLDTQTRPLDVREVQRGNYAELLNLCSLKNVKLQLTAVSLRGVSGWAAVGVGIRESWVRDVTQKQIYRILMGPSAIRSVYNVGQGMADLVLVPLEQYRKDGRLLRGLRKGAIKCLRNITIEALNASVGLTKVVASTLNDLVTIEGGREGGRDRLVQPDPQPKGMREGLEHAYDSLSRGLGTAAHTIIAIPIQEMERSGPRGSMRAVIRALPIAVVKPVVGVSEALSITLLGVRNKLDPVSRREEEELWRV